MHAKESPISNPYTNPDEPGFNSAYGGVPLCDIGRLPGCGLPEAVEGDRNGADASTGGVMDAVGDGSGDADQADLADAFGSEWRERIRFSDEDDIDVRSVGVDGDEVVAEGGVGDATGAGVDDVLLEQRLADAADRCRR